MSYEDYMNYADVTNEEMLLALGVVAIVFSIAMFIAWLITLYPRYYMVKASGVGPVWTAFIPIWQDIQLFKMAGWKWWSYWVYLIGFGILGCIPYVNVLSSIGMTVFLAILHWRVATNFGLGTGGKILTLLLGYIMYWYVAIVKKPFIGIYGGYAGQPQYNNYNNNGQAWYQNNGTQQPQDNSWYQQNPQQPYQNTQPQNEWYQQNNNPQQ